MLKCAETCFAHKNTKINFQKEDKNLWFPPMFQHFRPFQVGGPPAQMMRWLQPTNRKFYDNFSSEIINTYLKRFGVLSRSRY